jgi:hypothetical protein
MRRSARSSLCTAICHDGGMEIQMLTGSPRNERGGQVSHLLLAEGQFGAQRLCITWVECQQALPRQSGQRAGSVGFPS